MKRLLLISVLIFLAAAGGAIADEPPALIVPESHTVSEEEFIALDRGNEIISALERYYAGNGFYPNKLSELVPDYMQKIPYTGIRDGFFFRVWKIKYHYESAGTKYRPGYFQLDFTNKKMRETEYDSRTDSYHTYRSSFVHGVKMVEDVTAEDFKTVIAAVKAYFADNGRYPEKLIDLVPAHLAEDAVPLVQHYTYKGETFKTGFGYYFQQPLADDEPELPQSYRLSFARGYLWDWRYDSKKNEWEFEYD